MSAENDASNNAILRSLLELAGEEGAQLAGGSGSGGVNSENVAQLLAAAIAQVGQSILAGSGQGTQAARGEGGVGGETATSSALQTLSSSPSENLPVNPLTTDLTASGDGAVFDLREAYESVPQASTLAITDADVVSTVEVSANGRPRPLCVKFPIELRKQIISMRKSGKLSKDIAKELKVSVSGVQKVWERFLATGMAHDRKPSSYAGRPRKSTYSQEVYSPGFDLQPTDDVFQSPHMEYVATPSSAPPTTGGGIPPNGGDVIITDESEVFTEGATVEIVETTPLPLPPPKSPKRKGTPAYRGRLLLKLVDDCPLAKLRDEPDGLTNPHVQNLMVSMTRPLYMEYVLGHPFGKVPPSRPFDGCTPAEAEVILTDPANPVGKTVLAALGYSTKVYFNVCCKPSPLFDESLLLSSLPISLGPSHLADAMRNIIQLLVDLCVNPEEALNALPTAAGPLIVAKRGEMIVASHSIAAPGKLSEFWAQLYSHISLLQCCENFVSAHPPSAPCLLCHPFERFAQSLEILEPEEEEEEVLPSPLPLAHHNEPHLTPDLSLHSESQEVEVQVLESGTSGLTTAVPLQRPRGRGKGRKSSKQSEKQPPESPYSVYEEQNVVSDGEFEIPPLIEETPGSEVIVSHSGFIGMDSDQVEASEAAQNLALLATQSIVTSSLPTTLPQHQYSTMTEGLSPVCEVTVSLVNSVPASSLTSCEQTSPSTVDYTSSSNPSSPSGEQNVSSEIVAVAEVGPSLHESLTNNVLPSSNVAEVSIVGVGTQTEPRPVSHNTLNPRPITYYTAITRPIGCDTANTRPIAYDTASTRLIAYDASGPTGGVTTPHTPPKPTTPESLRRSRRKITRVRRLVSEEESNLHDSDKASETNSRTLGKRRETYTDSRTSDDASSALEDGYPSLPPAKRTRSKAVTRSPDVSEGDEGGVVYESGWGHPSQWGVDEVGQFIAEIPQCSGFKDVFVEHLVDGETLLSLDPQMMVKLMDLKTGPALRIHRYISCLKQHFSLS